MQLYLVLTVSIGMELHNSRSISVRLPKHTLSFDHKYFTNIYPYLQGYARMHTTGKKEEPKKAYRKLY